MTWFSRQSPAPKVRTSIGLFAFDGESWITETADDQLVILVCHEVLDMEVVARAAALVDRLGPLADSAIRFVRGLKEPLCDTDEELILESIDITDLGEDKMGIGFGVRGKPDVTVTVEFRGDAPCLAWAAD